MEAGPAKRILVINWRDIRNPEAGGAEVYYHEIVKRMAATGRYRITVLAHAFPGAPAEEEIDGTTVVRVGNKHLFNYAVWPWVRRRQGSFDLIMEDLNKIPFLTPLYTSRPRLHMVMHFFGGSIFKETAFPMACYVYLWERAVPLVYRRDPFVAISESTRAEVRRFCRSRIELVEPGVDSSFFQPTGAKDDPPLLVYIGRVKKYKNVQFLIENLPRILDHVPGARLEVAGTGTYVEPLKALAVRLGLTDKVGFPGFVSEEEKRSLLSRAALILNPSYKEGWGITNIEANLCGTVSVSSDGPGLRDSVRDGETGLLYRSDDREDFVAKTLHLLEHPAERAGMEKAAMEYARQFDTDLVAGRMMKAVDGMFQ